MSNNREFKSNKNIVFSCKYHVVFCPKYRRKVLVEDVEKRLSDLIQSISSELKVDLVEFEISALQRSEAGARMWPSSCTWHFP